MRRSLTAVAMALLAISTACADEADGSDAAPTTGEDTTSSADTECVPDDLEATDFEALTVDDVPDGFVRQPDDVGDTGPSDLAKAVRDDGNDDAEEVLTDLGFRRGYQWLWVSENGNELVSFVYEFCDERGARGYLGRGEELTEAEAVEVEDFDVPDLDEDAAPAGDGGGYQFAYVDTVERPYYVRIMTFAEPPHPSADDLKARSGAVAIAQLAELEEVRRAA